MNSLLFSVVKIITFFNPKCTVTNGGQIWLEGFKLTALASLLLLSIAVVSVNGKLVSRFSGGNLHFNLFN